MQARTHLFISSYICSKYLNNLALDSRGYSGEPDRLVSKSLASPGKTNNQVNQEKKQWQVEIRTVKKKWVAGGTEIENDLGIWDPGVRDGPSEDRRWSWDSKGEKESGIRKQRNLPHRRKRISKALKKERMWWVQAIGISILALRPQQRGERWDVGLRWRKDRAFQESGPGESKSGHRRRGCSICHRRDVGSLDQGSVETGDSVQRWDLF